MHEVPYEAFVLDDCSGIHDDPSANSGFSVHHGTSHHHRSRSQGCAGRDPRRGMHHGLRLMTCGLELLLELFSPPIVAQSQRNPASRLPEEPAHGAQNGCSQHGRTHRNAIIDEAFNRVANAARHLRDDAPMSTGAKDENGSVSHVRSIRRA